MLSYLNVSKVISFSLCFQPWYANSSSISVCVNVCTHTCTFSSSHAHPFMSCGFYPSNWDPIFRIISYFGVSGLSSCEDVTFLTPEFRWFSSGPSWVDISISSSFSEANTDGDSFFPSTSLSALRFQHGSYPLPPAG